MRLLDRYLLRELLIPLAYCLGGFLIFWIAFDLFSELDHFQTLKLGFTDLAEYYLFRLPELLMTVMPVALLLALLYALTNHVRYQELVAIRTAGVSIWRLSVPYLAVGLLFSLALFAVNDLWAHNSAQLAEQVLKRYDINPAGKTDLRLQQDLNFRNDREHRIWTVGVYDRDTFCMTNIAINWQLPGSSRREIYAAHGGWTNGAWTFQNVVQFTYLAVDDVPPPYKTNLLSFPEFTEKPAEIETELKFKSFDRAKMGKKVRFSLREIIQYLRWHPDLTGDDYSIYHTQLHGRLAAPWACLVVVLVALPFGAATGRRNVFVGVASSIFICFAYFVLTQLGLALGTGGQVPPWLAAWSPSLLFSAGGIVLTWRVR